MATPALPSNVTPITPQVAAQTAQQAAANAAAWGTQGAGYDPDKFFTAGKTSSTAANPNQYEYLKIKILPHIYQQLRDMIENKDVPAYDSPDDAIRDALYHRLHYLADVRGTPDFMRKVKSLVEQIEHEQAVTAAEIQWQKLTDLLARSQVMFEKYAEDEGWKMLHDMIQSHRTYADAWDDCKTKRQLLKLCDKYEKKIPRDILF